MSWNAITESDLLTRISGPELDGLRSAALGTGQDDPIDDAIDQVTGYVRGRIAANPTNTLGTAGTIPQSLLGAALDILVIEVSQRAAGTLIDPSNVRRDAANEARRLLADVASGKFSIDETSGTGSQTGTGVTRPQHSDPRVTRDNLKGL